MDGGKYFAVLREAGRSFLFFPAFGLVANLAGNSKVAIACVGVVLIAFYNLICVCFAGWRIVPRGDT